METRKTKNTTCATVFPLLFSFALCDSVVAKCDDGDGDGDGDGAMVTRADPTRYVRGIAHTQHLLVDFVWHSRWMQRRRIIHNKNFFFIDVVVVASGIAWVTPAYRQRKQCKHAESSIYHCHTNWRRQFIARRSLPKKAIWMNYKQASITYSTQINKRTHTHTSSCGL